MIYTIGYNPGEMTIAVNPYIYEYTSIILDFVLSLVLVSNFLRCLISVKS
jgi:hypothetical protein